MNLADARFRQPEGFAISRRCTNLRRSRREHFALRVQQFLQARQDDLLQLALGNLFNGAVIRGVRDDFVEAARSPSSENPLRPGR